MPTTIKDIAKAAGVSIGTVDRVIHNRPGVSPTTRDKVKKLLKEMNYAPSQFAQALVNSGKTRKLGVIYPQAEMSFWSEVHRATIDEQANMSAYGIEIVVKTTKTYGYEEQLKTINELEEEGVSGIVTIANHPENLNKKIEDLHSKGIAFATIVSDAPDSHRICFHGLENISAGEVAAKLMNLYMGDTGNIAIIGVHPDAKCIDDRITGFVQKTNQLSQTITIEKIVKNKEKDSSSNEEYATIISRLVEQLLDENPNLTGIYLTNSLTHCVAEVVAARNLSSHITIVGHERTPQNVQYLSEGIIDAIVFQDQYSETVEALRDLEKHVFQGVTPKIETNFVPINIMISENIY